MLIYHKIKRPYSTLLIQEIIQYVMNSQTKITDGLQVTITIKNYNQNTIVKIDIDLIITDLERTNRPPTTRKNDT